MRPIYLVLFCMLVFAHHALSQPAASDDNEDLARTHYREKRYVEAEVAAKAWLEEERKRKSQGEDANIELALKLLAEIQMVHRNLSGAEASLKELLQLHEERKASPREIAESLDQLIFVYDAQGQEDAAKPLVKRSWQLQSKTAQLSESCTVFTDAKGRAKTECGRKKRGKRKGERLEPDDHSAVAVVPVFFGTDRKRIQRQPEGGEGQLRNLDIKAAFDSNRNHQITLGKAIVTVPRKHKAGQVERPWRLTIAGFTAYEESENPNHHFIIKSIDVYDRNRFVMEANDVISRSETYKDQAFIFIHGYNIEFNDALFRTAQIAFDLQFDGAAFLYSWPSAGDPTAYQGDRSAATQSYTYIEEFLKLAVEKTKAKTVHIVAHSMGNVPLLNALENIARSGGFRDTKTVGQLVLAAPDVDRDEFANRLRSLQTIRAGGTLYASRQDKAMQISRVWNGGVPRAGDVPPDGPLISKAIYTIDASYLGTQVFAINHNGYAESLDLMKDISQLFRYGKHPPNDRWPMLRVMNTPKGSYWQYPP
jgi:esterase/lipase superfamily enzyme